MENEKDKVGIGTRQPEEKLHLFSNVNVAKPQTFAGLRFENNESRGGAYPSQIWDIKTDNDAVNFKFNKGNNLIETFPKMTLNS